MPRIAYGAGLSSILPSCFARAYLFAKHWFDLKPRLKGLTVQRLLFTVARHPQHDGARLAAELRQRAILVRHFNGPRIDQFLRISIGTDAECTALVNALGPILA